MTIDEIFTELSGHMTKGVMLHAQMADYYGFLALKGYMKAHAHHMSKELKGLCKLHRYFLCHYNRLIEEPEIENPDAIPATWYRYERQDVDASTKRNAVKNGIEKWVAWEVETKALLEMRYKELLDMGEVAAAEFIEDYIEAVDKELKKAQEKHICLTSLDYSLSYIIGEQDALCDRYHD